jgi:hypothetical protein
VTTVGTVRGVADPGAALQVARALALMRLAECQQDVEGPLDFPLAPIPTARFGDAAGGYARAAALINVAVLVLFPAVVLPIGIPVARLFYGHVGLMTANAAMAAVKFPGSYAIAFAFVAAGLAAGSVSAVAHSPTPGVDVPILLAVLAVFGAAIAAAARLVRRTVASKVMRYTRVELRYDAQPRALVFADEASLLARLSSQLLFGELGWIATDGDEDGVSSQTKLLYNNYRWAHASQGPLGWLPPYFLILELVWTATTCGVTALLPLQCGAVANTVAIVNLLAFATTAALRPFAVRADNVLAVLMNALNAAAGVMIAVGVQRVPASHGVALARAGTKVALAGTFVALVYVVLAGVRFAVTVVLGCRIRPKDTPPFVADENGTAVGAGAVPLLSVPVVAPPMVGKPLAAASPATAHSTLPPRREEERDAPRGDAGHRGAEKFLFFPVENPLNNVGRRPSTAGRTPDDVDDDFL